MCLSIKPQLLLDEGWCSNYKVVHPFYMYTYTPIIGTKPGVSRSFPPAATDFRQSHLQQKTCNEMPFRPRRLRADILHKNSFYYNQGRDVNESADGYWHKSVTEHNCEWKECTAKFLSSKELLKHVQEEHVSCLPLHNSSTFQPQRRIMCQWRRCKDNRCYPARYKLLLHLQIHHCSDQNNDKVRRALVLVFNCLIYYSLNFITE